MIARQIMIALVLTALILIGVIFLLRCKGGPVGPGPDDTPQSFPIKLSLEIDGRRLASFTGAPIFTIVETPDAVPFTAINWFTGKADFQASAATVQSTGKRFEVYLLWKSAPALRDSASAYDTIFVTTGGGLKRSNSVRVNVVNLPVVIDSIRAGTGTAFATMPLKDTVWSYMAADNVTVLTVQIFSRDLDGKSPPSISISGDDGRIRQSGTATTPFVLLYTLPAAKFSARVVFIVFDRNGSQAVRTVTFGRTNVPPVFDSVFVNGTKFATTAGLYSYSQLAIDTVGIVAYVHDANAYDTVGTFFRAGQKNNIITDATGRSRHAIYTCTMPNCLTEFRDTLVLVDTVTIKAYDRTNDTVYKYVQILHGRANLPPVVSAIKFGDTLLKGTDTLSTVRVVGPKAFRVVMQAADPYQDSLHYTFATVLPDRLSDIKDSAATYTSADTLGSDTLRITVADRRISVTRRIAVIVNDCVPVFDSLTIGDTVYLGTDTVFRYRECVLRDTVKIAVFVHDLDPQRDSIMYLWSGTGPGRFVSAAGSRATYRLADSTRNDTVICTIVDGAYRSSRRVVIPVTAHAPAVDSIQVVQFDSTRRQADTSTLAGSDTLFNFSANLRDSLAMRCFGHDIDKTDVLRCYWSAKKPLLTTVAGMFTASYRCPSAASADTLTVYIEDLRKLKATKRIQLNVGK